MKILLVMPSLRSGGAEKTFILLAEKFSELGHDVPLLTWESFDTTRLGNGLLSVSNSIKKVSLNKKNVSSSIFPLARHINKHGYEYVISTISHMNMAVVLSKLLNFQRYKLVIRDCSMYEKAITLKAKILNFIMRFTYKYANLLVCISDSNKMNLAECGVRNKNTKVIYNPIPTEQLVSMAKEPLPSPYGFLEKEPYVVTIARLDAVKNQTMMIRSFAMIANKIPHKLVFVGDGDMRETLESLANSLGIRDRVIFVGFQDNPAAFLGRATLFLLTSFKEAASRALMESVCLGIPAICVDKVGGPSEVLGYGKYGVILKEFDDKVLADAIYKEISNPSISKELLAERAKSFSVENNVMEYINVLSKM